MPQIFQVLRCYKCSVFQVHQTRKDNKWTCKLCGEKQSVKRHHGLGTSKDCRIHVQKLNKIRGEKDEASKNIIDLEDSDYDKDINNSTNNVNDTKVSTQNISKESKWSAYIDKMEQNEEIKQQEDLNDGNVFLEKPQKRENNSKYLQTKRLKHSLYFKEKSKMNMNNCIENEIDSLGIFATKTEGTVIKNFDIQEVCLKRELKSQINSNMTNENKTLNQQVQKVGKGSKWAHFIDEDEEENKNSNENNDKNIEKNCNKNPLFALCDDSEIDTILDL